MVPAGMNMAPETVSPQQGVKVEAETLRKGSLLPTHSLRAHEQRPRR